MHVSVRSPSTLNSYSLLIQEMVINSFSKTMALISLSVLYRAKKQPNPGATPLVLFALLLLTLPEVFTLWKLEFPLLFTLDERSPNYSS